MSCLDHAALSARLFFPRRRELTDAFVVETDGVRLACRRFNPFPDAGTLLHFHGNGEVVADYIDEFAELILGMGVNLCLAEYRGYGGSTGTPTLAAMLGDGDRIIEALGIPDERIAIYGRSLGSIYAIELASRRPKIAGLILESAIADVSDRVLIRVDPEEIGTTDAGLAAEVDRLFNHQAKLGHYPGPVLVLHTEHDGLIHRSHADRLYAWAAGDDKELVVFPRGDHNSLSYVNFAEYKIRLEDFFHGIGFTA